MSFLNMPLQCLTNLVVLGREFLTDNLGHVILEITQLLNLGVQSILLEFEFLRLLAKDFIPDFVL